MQKSERSIDNEMERLRKGGITLAAFSSRIKGGFTKVKAKGLFLHSCISTLRLVCI